MSGCRRVVTEREAHPRSHSETGAPGAIRKDALNSRSVTALAKPGTGSRTVGSERTVGANPGSVSARDEDAEAWCDRCHRRHGVNWIAPSDLWNAVMRDGDRSNPDEYGFCCPTCFMALADERGVGNHLWVVVPDPLNGPYGTVAAFFARAALAPVSQEEEAPAKNAGAGGEA